MDDVTIAIILGIPMFAWCGLALWLAWLVERRP